MKNMLAYVVIAICLIKSGSAQNYAENIEDINGNVYKTVKIGEQIWMAENLRTSRFNNGDLILPLLREGTTIKFEDDDSIEITREIFRKTFFGPNLSVYEGQTGYYKQYGYFYSWHSVNDKRNLCPPGWSIPSDEDWETLISYLGGKRSAGIELKSERTEPDKHPRWKQSRRNVGLDSEGFAGLSGGFRRYTFHYSGIEEVALWWSSTEVSNNRARGWTLHYNSGRVRNSNYSKTDGANVRCIKN